MGLFKDPELFLKMAENLVGGVDYQSDQCVICWSPNVTREHIVPKWLQEDEQIGTLRLIRPGGTGTQFRRATVPLCKPCNTAHLGRLETYVSKLVRNGLGRECEQDDTFKLWLTKIYLFIKIFEYLNPVHDKAVGKRRDFSEDGIRNLQLLSLKLREVSMERTVTMPNSDFASVWLFERSEAKDVSSFTFFADMKVLGMSLGGFYVFAVLGDWAQYKEAKALDDLKEGPLNRLDFLGTCGLLTYQVSRNGISETYTLMGTLGLNALTLSPNIVSASDINTTIDSDFAEHLKSMFPDFFGDTTSKSWMANWL